MTQSGEALENDVIDPVRPTVWIRRSARGNVVRVPKCPRAGLRWHFQMHGARPGELGAAIGVVQIYISGLTRADRRRFHSYCATRPRTPMLNLH